jgi:hypothetical protein
MHRDFHHISAASNYRQMLEEPLQRILPLEKLYSRPIATIARPRTTTAEPPGTAYNEDHRNAARSPRKEKPFTECTVIQDGYFKAPLAKTLAQLK